MILTHEEVLFFHQSFPLPHIKPRMGVEGCTFSNGTCQSANDVLPLKTHYENSNFTQAFPHRALAYSVQAECVGPRDLEILTRFEEISIGVSCSESI